MRKLLKGRKLYHIMYDEDLISYISGHSTCPLYNKMICKGKENDIGYIGGYAGFCCVLEADETKQWTLFSNYFSFPIVSYIKTVKDKNGYTYIVTGNKKHKEMKQGGIVNSNEIPYRHEVNQFENVDEIDDWEDDDD